MKSIIKVIGNKILILQIFNYHQGVNLFFQSPSNYDKIRRTKFDRKSNLVRHIILTISILVLN